MRIERGLGVDLFENRARSLELPEVGERVAQVRCEPQPDPRRLRRSIAGIVERVLEHLCRLLGASEEPERLREADVDVRLRPG
jgi:hypothetical protein